MATEPRVLGGIGLTGFWPEGFDGWKPDMDSNLLKLSALTQLTLNQAPTTALPTSPADGYIAIDPATREICVRDNDAWVRITPSVGWIAAYAATLYRYSGSAWVDVLAGVFMDRGVVPNGTDFNTLVDQGIYHISSNASAATMVNAPYALAGSLYVGRISTGSVLLDQMFVSYNGRIGARGASGGVFNGWQLTAPTQSPAFTGSPSTSNMKLLNTASADVNTLDYYEEGTFSPLLIGITTAGSATYGSNSGRYTRIGNRVFYSVVMALSSKGGMTGQVVLTGLPYAPINQVAARGAVSMSYLGNMNLTANVPINGFHLTTSARIQFYKQSSTGNNPGLLDTDITDTFTAYFSGQYEV